MRRDARSSERTGQRKALVRHPADLTGFAVVLVSGEHPHRTGRLHNILDEAAAEAGIQL